MDNTTTAVKVGTYPGSIAVNEATNKIYVANFVSENVSIIDGTTNTVETVVSDAFPAAVAVNPVTNQAYVANYLTSNVTVISDHEVQPNYLTATITPLPGNETSNATPSFTFGAASTTPSLPDGLYYQVDTWQGPWTMATGSNPYTGTLETLQPGFHILYAYAVDGQEATSAQIDAAFIGAIQAYGFVVKK